MAASGRTERSGDCGSGRRLPITSHGLVRRVSYPTKFHNDYLLHTPGDHDLDLVRHDDNGTIGDHILDDDVGAERDHHHFSSLDESNIVYSIEFGLQFHDGRCNVAAADNVHEHHESDNVHDVNHSPSYRTTTSRRRPLRRSRNRRFVGQ